MMLAILQKILLSQILSSYVSIYCSISYFGKRKENNEVDLISLENKLKFSIAQDSYKDEF